MEYFCCVCVKVFIVCAGNEYGIIYQRLLQQTPDIDTVLTRMHSSRMRTARFSGRLLGGCLPHTLIHTHMNRITDRCENITFPQLRLRAVNIKESRITLVTRKSILAWKVTSCGLKSIGVGWNTIKSPQNYLLRIVGLIFLLLLGKNRLWTNKVHDLLIRPRCFKNCFHVSCLTFREDL